MFEQLFHVLHAFHGIQDHVTEIQIFTLKIKLQ
jgi:hypothetical protein